jgi:hypothetical protein
MPAHPHRSGEGSEIKGYRHRENSLHGLPPGMLESFGQPFPFSGTLVSIDSALRPLPPQDKIPLPRMNGQLLREFLETMRQSFSSW